MSILAASPFPALILVAAFLMVSAGVGKHQLRWRTVKCPVCHHPPGRCTCRWL